MSFWFTEAHTENVTLALRMREQVYSLRSDYQQIDVFDSVEFGRVLALDGIIVMTEKDEFIYHEMLVHVPMAVHPKASSVLAVGAGDGGVLRELGKYPSLSRIDLVEIDAALVEVCRRHLPATACGYEDARVRVHNRDALRFLRRVEGEYDLIIIDSTDPAGPGEILFTREFYGSCLKALRPGGIMINQHESPFYEWEATAMRRAHRNIRGFFPIHAVYQAHIPTYPSGHWLFGFASSGPDPLKDLDAGRWNSLGIPTRYYNTDLHRGAFCLPNYVRSMIEGD